jgi:hypothetical protein
LNIVLIDDDLGIEVFKTWAEVKKHTSFEKKDFTQLGTDYILNATNDTFEIAKDIKLLEHVAAKKMFTKNKMDFGDLISIITMLLVFIMLVK